MRRPSTTVDDIDETASSFALRLAVAVLATGFSFGPVAIDISDALRALMQALVSRIIYSFEACDPLLRTHRSNAVLLK